MNIFERLKNIAADVIGVAPRHLSTEYFLQEKAEWEQQLIDARNGEFYNNERAIKDANEELERINAELVRRGAI